MGQSLFKEHLKFQNFDEIFYCGLTSLRNPILNYCLFKNHLKFQNFVKVFYCEMAKHGHKYLEVFRKCIYTKTTVRKKIMT